MARLGLIARALRRLAGTVDGAPMELRPLPPRGTPAASAAEYGTDAYRGMRMPHRDGAERGPQWWSDDPTIAETYTKGDKPNMMRGRLRLGRSLDIDAGGRRYDSLSLDQIPDEDLRRIIKAMAAAQGRADPAIMTNSIATVARDRGYDSVVFRNLIDDYHGSGGTPSTVYAMLAPHNVRLPHARFQDLASPDMLAATTAGAPLGLLALLRARQGEEA